VLDQKGEDLDLAQALSKKPTLSKVNLKSGGIGGVQVELLDSGK